MSRFFSALSCTLLAVAMISVDAEAAYDVASGKATYDATCAACHKSGLLGAPKLGDKAAWAPRIVQKLDDMVSKSIQGFQGKTGTMPARGGDAKLTDAQVGNAVAYMVGLVGQSK
ncbi:MAG: c-type cytochrome [Chlorobiaceae bacterium]|jgi:cytochrome c5